MAETQAVAELERFLTDRADHLLRAATLLTGSREAGQDLLQTALERLLRHWPTLDGDPEAYLRRTLYNLATDRYRRAAPAAAQAAPAPRRAPAGRRPGRRGGPARRADPAAAATATAAAGGAGVPVLGAAHRGGDRGAARLARRARSNPARRGGCGRLRDLASGWQQAELHETGLRGPAG